MNLFDKPNTGVALHGLPDMPWEGVPCWLGAELQAAARRDGMDCPAQSQCAGQQTHGRPTQRGRSGMDRT